MTSLEKLDNYVIMKRDLKSDYLNRKINKDEFDLIVWIRLSANPYGKATIGIQSLIGDVFHSKKSVNQITKMLSNLKKQRYLYFQARSGRRGSFEVHLPDFILPKTQQITSIDRFYEVEKIRGLGSGTAIPNEEVGKTSVDKKQSFGNISTLMNSVVSSHTVSTLSRGNNTYKDINNDNDKNHSSKPKKNRDTRTEFFEPTTLEEKLCKNFALKIGEEDMSYMLSISDRYGFYILEGAFDTFELRDTFDIANQPAYLNSIIEDTLIDYGFKEDKSQKI